MVTVFHLEQSVKEVGEGERDLKDGKRWHLRLSFVFIC